MYGHTHPNTHTHIIYMRVYAHRAPLTVDIELVLFSFQIWYSNFHLPHDSLASPVYDGSTTGWHWPLKHTHIYEYIRTSIAVCVLFSCLLVSVCVYVFIFAQYKHIRKYIYICMYKIRVLSYIVVALLVADSTRHSGFPSKKELDYWPQISATTAAADCCHVCIRYKKKKTVTTRRQRIVKWVVAADCSEIRQMRNRGQNDGQFIKTIIWNWNLFVREISISVKNVFRTCRQIWKKKRNYSMPDKVHIWTGDDTNFPR